MTPSACRVVRCGSGLTACTAGSGCGVSCCSIYRRRSSYRSHLNLITYGYQREPHRFSDPCIPYNLDLLRSIPDFIHPD